MESTFTADPLDTHRLILHEKAHFLWAYVLSSQLKADWITLGGWYPDPADPDSWSTTKQVEFVSAYAHQKNPDEDMAESIAFFVLNPDALRSRSLPKYEFIRDRIMHGTQFLAHIQPGLTFEVLDLFPDYAYPGKINRVDIVATGAPTADKQVSVEIGLDTADNVFAGASYANLRVFSAIGTYVDVWLYPANADGSVMRGSFPISKYAKAGFWHTDQITLTDPQGNQRMEGLEDFGWKLYIDNPLEDVTPPTYLPGSLSLDVTDDVITENGVAHPVQIVHATWAFIEQAMPAANGCYAALTNPSMPSLHAVESYGNPDPTTGLCRVDFTITEYQPSGTYGVPEIILIDAAGNKTLVEFADTPTGKQQPLVSVPITTTNPDTTPPVVSLNDDSAHGLHKIEITGTPTHPDAPDGETLVSIKFQARDDKSGLWYASYVLLDPQGLTHFQYFYPPSYGLKYFAGDPTAWTEYEVTLVLPPGSAPGTWGLAELGAYDKAGNQLSLNFVELLEFDVVK